MNLDDMMRLGATGCLISSIITFTPLPEMILGGTGVELPENLLFYAGFPFVVIFGAILVYAAWRKEKNKDGPPQE